MKFKQNKTDPKLQITEQDIYINETKKRKFPTWIIPIIFIVVITVVLIWLVPDIFSRYQASQNENANVEEEKFDPFLLEANVVFNQKSVPLLEEPDLRSIIITTSLYNEPARIIDNKSVSGYYFVELADGYQGYVKTESVTPDLISLVSDNIINKVVLINREKGIASDTTSGNIIATAPMGCVLYADYVTEQVVRIILPGGDVGWMSRENLLILQEHQVIPQPDTKKADIFCSSALVFMHVAYVPGGMDMGGIDIPGIVYLAGKTNGLDLPRKIEEQAKIGTQISFERDNSGLAHIDALKAGDLLFFSSENDSEYLTSSAIYMADGNILYADGNQSSIQLISLFNNEKLAKNLSIARRLFE